MGVIFKLPILVVLALGFLLKPDVDGLQCYICSVTPECAEEDSKECSEVFRDIPDGEQLCERTNHTAPSVFWTHTCTSRSGRRIGCTEFGQNENTAGVPSRGVTCYCETNNCNTDKKGPSTNSPSLVGDNKNSSSPITSTPFVQSIFYVIASIPIQLLI